MEPLLRVGGPAIGRPAEIASLLGGRRLVFTVTPGRSGTGFLARQLGSLPGVVSEHEPEPSFASVMRDAQSRPALARQFWIERKLPAIAARDASIYVETSHLFCKGFALPLLELGLTPDLIVLRRKPRRVALSLLELDTVPGRSPKGLRYLLSPDDPGVLPLAGWKELSDYQLCFWYCLEIERRQREYAALFGSEGARVVETALDEIRWAAGLERLRSELELPRLPWAGKIARWLLRPRAVNRKRQRRRPRPALDVERLEAELLECVEAETGP